MVMAALAVTLVGTHPLTARGASRQADAPAQLTYMYGTTGTPRDLQLVQDALNAILVKKINATVKLEPIDWGSFDQKMQLTFASGQPCDLVYTASWINNYNHIVADGDLLALDDLIKQYAPKTYATMPPSTWNAARIKGKLYAVINQQMFPAFYGALWRKDLAAKYHLDPTKLHWYSDLEPFLAQIKAHEPGITPIISNNMGDEGEIYPGLREGWDNLSDGATVLATDHSLHVFDPYESAAFKQAADLAYRWHQLGYMPKDPPPNTDALAAFQAGKYAVELGQFRPAEADKVKAQYGWDLGGKVFQKTILTTGAVTATMTGICRSSAHPVQAMQLLELLNTNKQVYNLITHGIEGKHYVVVDKARGIIDLPKGVTAATDGYYPSTDWEFGDQFIAYYGSAADVGGHEIQAKINRTAYPSVALGFALSPDPIKTQLAQVGAVKKQYERELLQGLVDPTTTIPVFIKALKAAGEDQVVAEVQRQLTAWSKTR
jgi:putative aldouronate transport system substrate-binding protein